MAQAVAAAGATVSGSWFAAETARAYAQICALGEQLAVANHSLEVVSREAEITQHRHEAGANSEFDVVRAQGLVAQNALRPFHRLQGQRRAALFQLAALLGRTPVKRTEGPRELRGRRRCSARLIPVGDGAALLKRRPDVRQAERLLAAATARIGIATADLYPRISLVGFLWRRSGRHHPSSRRNQGADLGNRPQASAGAFPNQALPRARGAPGQVQARPLPWRGFDSVVLNALKETETVARPLWGRARQPSGAGPMRKSRAHTAFTMAHDQFLAGSLSSLDLLTTEQALVAADAAVAASDSVPDPGTKSQSSRHWAGGGGVRRLQPRPLHGNNVRARPAKP